MLINNRQNGRRRGRGGPQVRNGAGGGDRGNRIDNRTRGNAAQLHEKYRNLARDAQTQGDRVMTEYYLQFADHYFRVLSETRARFEENQPRRQPIDEYDDGGDGEGFGGDGFGDDRMMPPQNQPRQERYAERPERQERYEPRGDQQPPRRDREVREGGRDGAREGGEGQRFAAPPPAPVNDAAPASAAPASAAPASGEAEPARGRRGRRPRRDGEAVAERIDADRLAPPAFLSEGAGPVAEAAPTAEDEEAPRRRRPRRPKGDGDSVAA